MSLVRFKTSPVENGFDRMFRNIFTDDFDGFFVKPLTSQFSPAVNVIEGKKLTNMRASGSDAATNIAPKTLMTLEECMEYIQQDECIEVTPNFIRMRKVILDEETRKKESKKQGAEA